MESIFDMPNPTSVGLNHNDETNNEERIIRKSPMTSEDRLKFRREQSERIAKRKESVKERIAQKRKDDLTEKLSQMRPDMENTRRLSIEELEEYVGKAAKEDPKFEKQENTWLRNLWGKSAASVYELNASFADNTKYYEPWATAWRMLGVFIDCDNGKDDHHDNNNNHGYEQGDMEVECNRWVMWAAYVNPNYQGGGYREYFPYDTSSNYYNQPFSKLDCHSPDTEWLLLGIYKIDVGNFLQQLYKHVWSLTSKDYVVARAGADYLEEGCEKAGGDGKGNYLYKALMPLKGGTMMMGLYRDQNCLVPDTTSGLNADSFGKKYTYLDLGDCYKGYLDDDVIATLTEYWENAQEYTLTDFNEAYAPFRYCTLCLDNPAYQDGYLIGGGDGEGGQINQCYKFMSHDAYGCTGSCLYMGSAQGTINKVKYGDYWYGQVWEGTKKGNTGWQSMTTSSMSKTSAKFSSLKANIFVTMNALIFITMFFSYSVAKKSLQNTLNDDKSAGLLPSNRINSLTRQRSKDSVGSSSVASTRSNGMWGA
jgi:hypothetical protein